MLLTKWYQSVVMTITSQRWLRPLFRSYLWTVENSANVFYGRILWMFHLDDNRDGFFYIGNWLNDMNPMQINYDCIVSNTIWFTIDLIYETVLLRFDPILWQLEKQSILNLSRLHPFRFGLIWMIHLLEPLVIQFSCLLKRKLNWIVFL